MPRTATEMTGNASRYFSLDILDLTGENREYKEREREQVQASSDRSAVHSQHASGEETGRIQGCNTGMRSSSSL